MLVRTDVTFVAGTLSIVLLSAAVNIFGSISMFRLDTKLDSFFHYNHISYGSNKISFKKSVGEFIDKNFCFLTGSEGSIWF